MPFTTASRTRVEFSPIPAVNGMTWFGMAIDPEKNVRGAEGDISTA